VLTPVKRLHHFSTACSPEHTLAAGAGHYRVRYGNDQVGRDPTVCRPRRGRSQHDRRRGGRGGGRPGETLATQGDLGHALFAIGSGTVEVSANGRRLATLSAGDVFGEVAVLAAGIRMATVVAKSPVRLIALLKRDVWAIERRSPETAERLRALIKQRLDFGRDPAA
jgi:CRP-like cAMP-binding protein